MFAKRTNKFYSSVVSINFFLLELQKCGRLLPPLNVTKKEINLALNVINKFVRTIDEKFYKYF